MLYSDLLDSLSIVPVGERSVARLGDRFCIYLPSYLNSLWSALHGSRLDVLVQVKGELEAPFRETGLVPFRARITKAGGRFLIYLPQALSTLWSELNGRGVKVEVAIRRSRAPPLL